jgi:uncharacterized membrane protein required for colicin V production
MHGETLPFDAGALGLLALFAVWGAWRGPLRQVASVVLLVGALWIAGRFGDRFQDAVAKVVTLTPEERCLAAWGVVATGCAVAASLVLGLFARRRAARHPALRVAGAALGLVKGALVLAVVAYAALAIGDQPGGGAWSERLAASRAARGAHWVVHRLREFVPAPACVVRQTDDVDRAIDRAHDPTPPGTSGGRESVGVRSAPSGAARTR